QFSLLAFTKMGMTLSTDTLGTHYFAPARFWSEQALRNDGRWEKNPEECQLLYERDLPAYNVTVAERVTRPALLPTKLFQIVKPLRWVHRKSTHPFPIMRFTWFAALGFLGIAALFIRKNWREAALLMLPCGAYLVVIYSIGDAVPRYLLAVEWLGLIFAALGCDLILDGLCRLAVRKNPEVVEQKLHSAGNAEHAGDDEKPLP
ncbi:MAG: hypothetical protein QOD99_222, partial [Chthoniobacter sp.]|nr:hypothetical protein [Chthoniobacter sp.]